MKALFSVVGLLTIFCSPALLAQNIPEDNIAPVKFNDIKRQFEASRKPASEPRSKSNQPIGEKEDYLDGRWLWYWGQHTDANGYIVSPVKTFREWNAYKDKKPSARFKTTNQSQWTFTGPTSSLGGYSGIGRVNNIAFHPTNASTYWIASAGGGAWKTINDGISWTPVADYLSCLSVSDIDFNPLNPNTVYMCTGDRDGRDHYSIGVLKSYDGGATWDTTGLNWNETQLRLTNCLLVNPLDTNRLILATSEGIYRSFNGGQTFSKVKSGNFKQVLFHPTDTAVVYATSFYTYANNTDAQIFRSSDGGATWTQVSALVNCWRVELAVTPADVGIVKAVAASRDTNFRRGLLGVYSSNDTGKTFQTVLPGHNCSENILSNNVDGLGCTGQGNYDLCITIDPSNTSHIYVGGVNTWTSFDGGSTWQIVNQWFSFLPGLPEVHADKHYLGFHPLVPGKLYECNDGGVYNTVDPFALLWNDISNTLGITQFYRNAVADISPYVLGGAQDNGTKIFDSGLWDDISGGDGMDCQIDPVNPDIMYSSIQYGGRIFKFENFMRSDLTWGFPGNPEGAWITPFILPPNNPNEMLAGYKDIYLGDNQGSWMNLTNGGIGNQNMLRLAMSPAGPTTLYAVPEYATKIYKFNNYLSGTASTINSPYPEVISDIKVHPDNKDLIFVAFSGYGANKVARYSPSGGWISMNENLPNVPVNCIEIDSSNGLIYIGTDVAVFYRSDSMTQWELYNDDLPAVHITDLGINYLSGELWAATYGRGMWKSPKATTTLDVSIVPYSGDFMQVYPNPARDAFTVDLPKSYAGKLTLCRLVDQSGKIVWQQEVRASAAASLSVTGLSVSRGSYILEVLSNNTPQGRVKLLIY